MHFWIDKRVTTCHYGRRRPNMCYSSGTFASSAFGRERINSLRSQSSTSSLQRDSPYSERTSSSRLGSVGEEQFVRHSPRHYYGDEEDQSRAVGHDYMRSPRRPSTYPPIPDPSVQEALDELQQELQASLPPAPPSPIPRRQPSSSGCLSTKHLGFSLCFLSFILLCTVAGKYIIEGPGVIDSARRPSNLNSTSHHLQTSNQTSVSFFLISEVVFVAFALGLFLTGVACLRKRTNEYLMGRFQQHIINSSHQPPNDGGGSSRSSGTTIVSDEEAPNVNSPVSINLFSNNSVSRDGRLERRSHRYILDGGTGPPGRSRRCYNYTYNTQLLLLSKQKPPPYDVALYLPLPNQHPPHHTTPYAPPTIQSEGDSKEEDEKSWACDDVSVSTGAETPPPAYKIQFSYDI